VVVSYDDISAKNYSLSAGQYFEVKIEYVDISQVDFESKLSEFDIKLNSLFSESKVLEEEIKNNIARLNLGRL